MDEKKEKSIFQEFLELLRKYYGILIILFVSIFFITFLINFLIAKSIKNKALKVKESKRVEKIILSEPIVFIDYSKEYLIEKFNIETKYTLEKEKIKNAFTFTDFGNNINFYYFPDYLIRKTLIFLLSE
ncbi:MAG: hypothetical protein N3A58_06920 [Spirochaetes bacterium]|nr:hypothetical protein [Spirochaetota bacterium]